MGGGASAAGDSGKTVKPNKKPSVSSLVYLRNEGVSWAQIKYTLSSYLRIQTMWRSRFVNLKLNSIQLTTRLKFWNRRTLLWRCNFGGTRVEVRIGIETIGYYLMELVEMEARDLMTDEVLDGTVLKSYKFTINEYGEYLETRNV